MKPIAASKVLGDAAHAADSDSACAMLSCCLSYRQRLYWHQRFPINEMEAAKEGLGSHLYSPRSSHASASIFRLGFFHRAAGNTPEKCPLLRIRSPMQSRRTSAGGQYQSRARSMRRRVI